MKERINEEDTRASRSGETRDLRQEEQPQVKSRMGKTAVTLLLSLTLAAGALAFIRPGEPAQAAANSVIASAGNTVTTSRNKAAAADTTLVSGDFTFTLHGNGEVSVTGYTGKGGYVVIPGEVEGHAVTRIGASAFEQNSALTGVVIPKGVTVIGTSAFSNCRNLTEVQIPEGVTEIGDYAFELCERLPAVHLPEGLKSIGYRAFFDCFILSEITIPEGVTSLSDDMFFQCDLESVALPDSLTRIDGNPFCGNYYLTDISVSADHPYLEFIDGSLISKPDHRLITYACGRTDTEYTIPEGVRVIEYQAFRGANVESVTLPDSLEQMKGSTFIFAPLKRIRIPAGLRKMSGEFNDCPYLTDIEVAEDNPVYADMDGVLYEKATMTLLAYPSGRSDTSYEIPDGIRAIDWYAFYESEKLRSVVIPESVKEIGHGAFRGCSRLESVNIPSGVREIEGQAFLYCSSLREIVIPDGVTSIGSDSFEGCNGLRSVTIPASVQYIGDDTFNTWDFTGYTGYNLEIVFTVPEGSYAWQWCTERGFTCVTE